MLLPKFVVTAYLALQSQRTTSEDYGSVQQIQSPLQDGDAASVGEYVIEINGEPIVKEHVDIMIPHGSSIDESDESDESTEIDFHRPGSPPPRGTKYVTFDDWHTGKVNTNEHHNGVTLSGGFIYDFRDFKHVPNEFHLKKFWGIPTTSRYTELVLKVSSEKRKFTYNIGYIYNGTLTAATFDVWYKPAKQGVNYKLDTTSTWLYNAWKENTVRHVSEIRIVLSGFFSRHGVLAFYDWGYQN